MSELFGTIGTVSVQSSTVATGAYSVKCTNTGGGAGYAFFRPFNIATGYARFRGRVHITTLPGSNTESGLFALSDQADQGIAAVMVRCTTAGALSLIGRNYKGGTYTASEVAISADTDYLIELRVTVSATVGVVEWRLNGVVQGTLTSQNTGTSNIGYVYIGVDAAQGSFDHYGDDVNLNDAAYPGDGRVIARQGLAGTPNADAWTKVGGATAAINWSNTPFGTTNRCEIAGTTAQNQTMLVESFSVTQTGHGTETITGSDTINAVCLVAICKVNNTSSPPAFNLRRRFAAANTDQAFTLTTADARYTTTPFTTTLANINAMECGGTRGTSAASRTVTIEDIWVCTDYTPAAAPTGPPAGSLALGGVGR